MNGVLQMICAEPNLYAPLLVCELQPPLTASGMLEQIESKDPPSDGWRNLKQVLSDFEGTFTVQLYNVDYCQLLVSHICC